MKLPRGFIHKELQGIDSTVGEIRGKGIVIEYDLYGEVEVDCRVPAQGEFDWKYFLQGKVVRRGVPVCYWLEFQMSEADQAKCEQSTDESACRHLLYAQGKERLEGLLRASIFGASFTAQVKGQEQVDTVIKVVANYRPSRD